MPNRNKIETKISKAQLLTKSLASKLTLYMVFGQSISQFSCSVMSDSL